MYSDPQCSVNDMHVCNNTVVLHTCFNIPPVPIGNISVCPSRVPIGILKVLNFSQMNLCETKTVAWLIANSAFIRRMLQRRSSLGHFVYVSTNEAVLHVNNYIHSPVRKTANSGLALSPVARHGPLHAFV